jgi:hypothetical protein
MSFSNKMKNYQELFKSLYDESRNKLGFEPHAKIVLVKNNKNSENPLGKTAFYSPSDFKIAIYSQGRHIKDILRSLSHELVHHAQNCRGDFNTGAATVEGYAQNDEHLREMEREAYETGNMIFRDWEDKLKSKGGASLFINTDQPQHLDGVMGEKLVEGEKMKNKVNESHLRDIIQGVIKEMFNDDLSEGTIEDMERDNAEVSSAIASSVDDLSVSVDEGRVTGDPSDDPTKAREDNEIDYEPGKVGGKVMQEDSGEDEAWNDWKNEHADDDHIKEIEHHLRALKGDRDHDEHEAKYDHDKYEDEGDDEMNEQTEELEESEELEELEESFRPDRNKIKAAQRSQLNERLTKLWAKK